MTNILNTKPYNLEDRTLEYAKRIIHLCKAVPRNIINDVLIKQLMRSGTSIGANYREANETETKKDFLFKIRICRKESKESIFWLNLIIESNPDLKIKILPLVKETEELLKIFASICIKSK